MSSVFSLRKAANSLLVLTLVYALFFWGCSKDVKPASTISDISPKSGQPGTVVTIAGTGFSNTITDNMVSFNGMPATVTSASGTKLAVTAPTGTTGGAVSVNVFGKTTTGPVFTFYSVYAFGNYGSAATYWKDGVQTALTGNGQTGIIYDMAVVGSDVHAVGVSTTTNKPTYWKNGVEIPMVIPISVASQATLFVAIAVSGSDVYICGQTYLGSPTIVAKIWKNGVEIPLTNGTTQSELSDIEVLGSDVYVCGYENSYAKYWKNGVPTLLSDGSRDARATGIVLVGQDIYVSGWESVGANGIVKYWKNGIANTLTDGNTATFSDRIAVSGSDVYVSGFENITKSTGGPSIPVAKYWKNGVATSLADGHSVSLTILNDDLFVTISQDSIYKNGQLLPPFPIANAFLFGSVIVGY